MLEVLKQVGILFAFMAAGFLLSKIGLVKADQSKILSTLVVYVFLPCNIFKTYAANFTIAYITEKYLLLLVGLAITIALMIIGRFGAIPLTKSKYERGIYEYSLIVPNSGYIGYPLTESLMAKGLLSNTALLNLMVFGIPISLYIYTVGYCRLTKASFTLKNLMNPIMITTFAGMIAGLVSLPIPEVINSALTTSSSCMGPVAMLLAGITLSQYDFAPLFKKPAVHITVVATMLVVPICLALLLPILGVPKEVTQIAVLYFSLPCGMNTIVFPKLVGENCEIGVSLALLSNLIACISIPVILSVFVI
ncbi:MAG: AEC family transporter [Acutalibacteraceae bacterium]|nr:AEC family transporter [Acutalibacteraceae bacterium]